jgi:hypothetical protein
MEFNRWQEQAGAGPGAGRPKSRRGTATIEMRATFEGMARAPASEALEILLALAHTSESGVTRMTEAKAIIERGYGTPLARGARKARWLQRLERRAFAMRAAQPMVCKSHGPRPAWGAK